MLVQRQKAVDVMKEISVSCKLLNPKEVSLEPSSEAEQHFEIHIKGHVDDESWECLKALGKKHGLGMRVTDHTLIIYASENKRFGKLTFE